MGLKKNAVVRFTGILLLVCLCFFPMSVQANSVKGGTVHDSVGDWLFGNVGSSYTDLTKIHYSVNKTTMTVTLTLAGIVPSTPSSSRLFYTLEIDSDQNPLTGRTDLSGIIGMGVDYEIAVHYEADTHSWYYTVWHFNSFQDYTDKNSDGGYVIFRNNVKMMFPLSEIATPSNFNMAISTWEYQTVPTSIWAWDFAPNADVIALEK